MTFRMAQRQTWHDKQAESLSSYDLFEQLLLWLPKGVYNVDNLHDQNKNPIKSSR